MADHFGNPDVIAPTKPIQIHEDEATWEYDAHHDWTDPLTGVAWHVVTLWKFRDRLMCFGIDLLNDADEPLTGGVWRRFKPSEALEAGRMIVIEDSSLKHIIAKRVGYSIERHLPVR